MKTSRIFLIILAIVIILPLLGRLLWELKKSHDLDIIIINKTVPATSRNELKGLNWTLNNDKYIRSTHYRYNYKTDYFGFHPNAESKELMIKTYGLGQIKSLAEKNQAVFFIDNEGVDLEGKGLQGKGTWYGGLNQNDYILLKEMVTNSKLILTEYNFFAEPTENLVRNNTEQLIDIFYVGWKGRYLKNLESDMVINEIPAKWIDRYRELTGQDWNFNGPGIIMIKDSENRILVIPAAEYMNSRYPVVKTNEEQSLAYNLPASTAYTGWFYVVYHGKNNIISEFDLNLNEKGIGLLYENGLESVFPAVLCSPDKRFYFVAGDFSKSNVCLTTSKICLIKPLIVSISGKMTNNPQKFFQTYYNRLLSSVLNNYYSEIKK